MQNLERYRCYAWKSDHSFKLISLFELPRSPVCRIEISTASAEVLVIYSDCFDGSITESCKIFEIAGSIKEIVVNPSDIKMFFPYLNNPTNFMAQISLQSALCGTLVTCFKMRTA